MFKSNLDIISRELELIAKSDKEKLLSDTLIKKINDDVERYVDRITRIVDHLKSSDFILDSTSIAKKVLKEEEEC